MEHEIHTIVDFKIVAPYTIYIKFDDESSQIINFLPLLRGKIYSPLQNIDFFNQVRLDYEAGTLIWPNDADFDPATLHDWDKVGETMTKLAQSWPIYTIETV